MSRILRIRALAQPFLRVAVFHATDDTGNAGGIGTKLNLESNTPSSHRSSPALVKALHVPAQHRVRTFN